MRQRFKKALVHFIAECKNCDWRCEDHVNGQDKTRQHADKTGHSIVGDLGYAFWYNAAGRKAKEAKP